MTRNLALPLLGIIIAAFGGIFALDMMFPLGTAVWLLYLLPLTLASATRMPTAPIVVALLACVAMAAGFMLDRSGIAPQVAALNRSMAGLVYVALGITGRSLILNRLRLTRTQWVNQAQIDVSRGMQGDLSPERLAKQVLTILADRLGARAAVVYARNGSGHRLLSSWGADAAA